MANLNQSLSVEHKNNRLVRVHPKEHRREEMHFFSITDTVVVTRSDPLHASILGGQYTAWINGVPASIINPLDESVLARQLNEDCLYGRGENPDEAVLDLLLSLSGLEGNINAFSGQRKVYNIYFLRFLAMGYEEDREYEDNYCFILRDMSETLKKLYPKTCKEIQLCRAHGWFAI